jgi:hypothetical protein
VKPNIVVSPGPSSFGEKNKTTAYILQWTEESELVKATWDEA